MNRLMQISNHMDIALDAKVVRYCDETQVVLSIINNPKKIYPTHIILSAFHFGVDINNISYIHLNNYKPSNKMYNDLWIELKKLLKKEENKRRDAEDRANRRSSYKHDLRQVEIEKDEIQQELDECEIKLKNTN